MPTRPHHQVPSTTEHVFVYGTLRRGHDHPMAAMLAARATHLGRGVWRGRLYDLGPYPAAVRTAGGTDVDHVVGDVYKLDSDPALLAALDDYEGHDVEAPRAEWYQRSVEPVMLDDGRRLHAHVYRYTGPVDPTKRIPGGDYVKHQAARAMNAPERPAEA